MELGRDVHNSGLIGRTPAHPWGEGAPAPDGFQFTFPPPGNWRSGKASNAGGRREGALGEAGAGLHGDGAETRDPQKTAGRACWEGDAEAPRPGVRIHLSDCSFCPIQPILSPGSRFNIFY